LFTLGSYFFIADVHSPQIWSTFFHGKGEALILTKKCVGLHFGRIFSKTQLVTLVGGRLYADFNRPRKKTRTEKNILK
jgi:hypothetical protein